jgi:hypothetical protein
MPSAIVAFSHSRRSRKLEHGRNSVPVNGAHAAGSRSPKLTPGHNRRSVAKHCLAIGVDGAIPCAPRVSVE